MDLSQRGRKLKVHLHPVNNAPTVMSHMNFPLKGRVSNVGGSSIKCWWILKMHFWLVLGNIHPLSALLNPWCFIAGKKKTHKTKKLTKNPTTTPPKPLPHHHLQRNPNPQTRHLAPEADIYPLTIWWAITKPHFIGATQSWDKSGLWLYKDHRAQLRHVADWNTQYYVA